MSDSNPKPAVPKITWDDVLKPGESLLEGRADPFVRPPGQDLALAEFSPDLASFLAAQSLLSYRTSDERHRVWDRLGLRESHCTADANFHCSIIEPRDKTSDGQPSLIIFRGTSHFRHWLANLQSLPKSWPQGGHVHNGFADALEEIWVRIATPLEQIVAAGRPLLLSGHSLGAALATLTLSRLLAQHGTAANIAAYTFGSPRVGNTKFAHSLSDANLYRIVNNEDMVTRLPLPFKPSRRLSFHHAGESYFVDSVTALHARGPGDLEEESASLTQLKTLLSSAFAGIGNSEPPGCLADHAPISYIERLVTSRE